MSTFLFTLFLSLGINIALFIPAYTLKTDKLTDISYALTFLVIAYYVYSQHWPSSESLLLFVLIMLWALRLGVYLLIRIHTMGRDMRFDTMRRSFWRFGAFWVFQAVTVWVVMLPSIFFMDDVHRPINDVSTVGFSLWLLGLLIETIADWQKFRFKKNSAHNGMWVQTGLWKYSRHPNFFGEIMVWCGIYLYTVTALTVSERWIGLISPLYITVILVFVSGIPMLEKSADAKYGTNPEYRQYKARTSMLIPWLRSKKVE